MTMTAYFAKSHVIDNRLRNQVLAAPTTLYLACFTTACTKAGGGTELTGGGYARQSVALDAGSGDGVTSNTATVTFPTATASLGTIIYVAIFDAVTAGNMLLYQALHRSRGPLLTNDVYRFLAGELDFTFD